MIEAAGQGGQMQFDGQYVTITRNGFLARATHGRGDKKIPLTAISAVQWKPAGMTNGFIQLSIGGADRQAAKGGRTMNAAKDENSVVFTRKQQPAFEALRAALEQAIAERHAPAAPAPAASVADELGKLAELHRQGVLNDDEFAAQKARILGS